MNTQLAQITVFPGADFDREPGLLSGAAIGDDRVRALAVGAYNERSWGSYNGHRRLPAREHGVAGRVVRTARMP